MKLSIVISGVKDLEARYNVVSILSLVGSCTKLLGIKLHGHVLLTLPVKLHFCINYNFKKKFNYK